MHKNIEAFIEKQKSDFDKIRLLRQDILGCLAMHVYAMMRKEKTVNLLFLCPDNSCRSQLAQVWAQVAAWHYFGHSCSITSHSGGSIPGSILKEAIEALERVGCPASPRCADADSVYQLLTSLGSPGIWCHSKQGSSTVPKAEPHIAVLTCSPMEAGSFAHTGSTLRFLLPMMDPNLANASAQASFYDRYNAEIAHEMLFLFHKVKERGLKLAA
ncbi:MAG: hypothetical protein ACK50T_03365 [Sphingobacteriia bacterium]